ncbi:MAG: hypothetical protein OER82_03810 [Nitrosopumilus sp.]|nr:hypothetical protein [Nitrosopumilus sp.]
MSQLTKQSEQGNIWEVHRIMKSKTSIYKRSWRKLTPRQKSIRTKSLSALSILRKSKSGSARTVANQHDLELSTVIRHTNGFKKINGRLVVKQWDVVPRVMLINENGQEKSIEIKNSKTAGVIGRYHNVVKHFLNTGDKSKLNKFRNKKVKDYSGKIHRLETNPDEIIKINQRIEEPEFFEVYAR